MLRKKKSITGVHLGRKQKHWYILGSVSASLFQLKQLRVGVGRYDQNLISRYVGMGTETRYLIGLGAKL